MTAAPVMTPFDVCGPLPSGVTVLEASAGTGKTFTIAALATRFVAEGHVDLENLLLVTFTRMATGELRQRVRDRMVSAEQGLTAALRGVTPDPEDDAVLALLATGTDDEVRARRDRLRNALANFDGATIDTTHAFCQRVLNGLGVTGDVDRDAAFIEDSTELVDEVVADFYLRKFAGNDTPDFSVDEARRIAHLAVANTDAAIRPSDPNDIRHKFAVRVRDEVDRRRRVAAVLTFDDLLTRLKGTLADPVRGELACRRLRERYRVALVDEFQDTDPVQWDILQRAFVDGDADATLVLIGDPKQAIYAFRGADVYAYLDAAAMASGRATLDVNWRSDQAVIDAYDALFANAQLGHADIGYRTVRAASGEARRMEGAHQDAALRIRMLHRDDGLAKLTPKSGAVQAGSGRAVVARDVAGDIVRLLSSGAQISRPPGEERESATVPIRPGHIAVLVQRNVDAMSVRDALHAVGVPAVVAGAGSVFATKSAREWLRLLEALERPTSSNNVRGVALTAFVGWSPERVATATDVEWEDLHARLHRWAAVLRKRGVAALLEAIAAGEDMTRRVLGRMNGERELTDIRHVGQLLHAAAMAEQLGMTALAAWLHTRIDEAEQDASTEDRSRRLESDAEAVQVLTVYRSKGLEFSVVYCPFLWAAGRLEDDGPAIFHDPANGGRRTIDVAGNVGRGYYEVEARGEELRLLYVALTRARHQAVVWWVPGGNAATSSLCRLLFHRNAEGAVSHKGHLPDDTEALARFEELRESAPAGAISVERVDGGDGRRWTSGTSTAASLDVSVFDRTLDPTWRRTSYSALTAAAHELHVGSEAEEPVVTDEVLPPGTVLSSVVRGADDRHAALRSVPLPLSVMRAGAEVGTFVHGVFEGCDFTASDLDASLADAFAGEAARRFVDVGDRAAVLAGLRAVVETPLGPVVGDVRLRDIGRRDRVDELAFELPLVGGDDPTGTLDVASIGRLLEDHLADDDILRPYAARLGDPVLQSELRGYLTGSIDLVLRTPDGRYAVVDYKTNRLGRSDEELTAWHYRPDAVADAMFAAHYPLQALLYTVALHRYLRWRAPGYSADRDLAGVLYLFVRGMVGADTPRVDGQPRGVFAWKPPAGLVEAMSDLFDSGLVPA
ncbi:MAG TPA: UvrD-helicase domain-containing protein [Acidimicrobiales bacterium]|nr:UvrD-helicase domain-containing protein [Acidimicrobiales bacterium]